MKCEQCGLPLDEHTADHIPVVPGSALAALDRLNAAVRAFLFAFADSIGVVRLARWLGLR